MFLLERLEQVVFGAYSRLRSWRLGETTCGRVAINGHPDFRVAVVDALVALRDRQSPAWPAIQECVKTVVEGWRSVAVLLPERSIVFLHPRDTQHGGAYLAGVLAHQAQQAAIYRDLARDNSGKPNRKAFRASRASVEKACEQAYQDAMNLVRSHGAGHTTQ